MLHFHYGKMLFPIRVANIRYALPRFARAKEVLKPWFQRAFLHTFVALDKSMPSETGHAIDSAGIFVSASAKPPPHLPLRRSSGSSAITAVLSGRTGAIGRDMQK